MGFWEGSKEKKFAQSFFSRKERRGEINKKTSECWNQNRIYQEQRVIYISTGLRQRVFLTSQSESKQRPKTRPKDSWPLEGTAYGHPIDLQGISHLILSYILRSQETMLRPYVWTLLLLFSAAVRTAMIDGCIAVVINLLEQSRKPRFPILLAFTL